MYYNKYIVSLKIFALIIAVVMNYESELNYILEELENKHLCFYFSHTKEEIEKYKINSILNKENLVDKGSVDIKYFEPDIYVEPSIEDYENNVDSILNTAIEMIKNSKKEMK